MTARHCVLLIFTDGVARGNPGEGGFGAIIKGQDGKIIEEIGGYLGRTTNNYAEYSALIAALNASIKYNPDKVEIYSDSQLLVRQINGLYSVKSESLLPLFNEARRLISILRNVIIFYIPREKNKEADVLANRAVDQKVPLTSSLSPPPYPSPDTLPWGDGKKGGGEGKAD